MGALLWQQLSVTMMEHGTKGPEKETRPSAETEMKGGHYQKLSGGDHTYNNLRAGTAQRKHSKHVSCCHF